MRVPHARTMHSVSKPAAAQRRAVAAALPRSDASAAQAHAHPQMAATVLGATLFMLAASGAPAFADMSGEWSGPVC